MAAKRFKIVTESGQQWKEFARALQLPEIEYDEWFASETLYDTQLQISSKLPKNFLILS